MEEKIHHLDDTTALQLLSTIAQPYTRTGDLETQWTPELRQALINASGIEESAEPVTEGDLARQALLLLAEDPKTRQALETRLDHPGMESFGAGTLLLGVTAALVVLQTRFEVERDKDGKVSWKIRKEAIDSAVLKELVRKVAGFLPGS